MRNLKIKALSLTFLIFGMGAIAQTQLSVSLDQAKQYAVQHNRTLQGSSLAVQKAEAAKWQSVASMLPQVNASYEYLNYCGYNPEFEMMGQKISMAMNPNGTFSLQATIAVSGAQIVRAQLSYMAFETAKLSSKNSDLSIRSNVTETYNSILMLEKTKDLLESNLANVKQIAATTQNSVKAGVAEQTDADKIQVQVSTMENAINTTKRTIEALYNSLRLLMGTDVNCELILTDKLDNLMQADKAMALLNQQFNIDENYDYQLLKANADISKKQITLSKWNYGPTLSAFYQYTNKSYFDKDAGMNMTPPNTVGVTVSMPLFTSGSNYSKYKEAKIAYASTINTMEQTADQLKMQDRQLRYNLSSAYESYQTQKKNMEVSQKVFNNIALKFKYGRASSLEVTQASTDLINVQNSYVQAMLDLVKAQIALEQLLNK